MSANRIKIKLLRVASLTDPKIAALDYGEHVVIEDTGALYYKHAISGAILSSSGAVPPPVIASNANLGVIKIGAGLTIDGAGTVSVTSSGGGSNYTLPTASSSVIGGIKIGSGLTIDGAGTVSAIATNYVLPIASNSNIGGIKIGAGLSIDNTGTVSVTSSGGGSNNSTGNANVFEFTVQFSGSMPSTVNNLPNGWTASISGTTINITHSVNIALKSIQYWGYSLSGGLERYRLPSASLEATIPYANRLKEFDFVINTSVAGADSDSTARIVVMF